MRKKILTGLAATAMLTLFAGPAAAHPHAQAGFVGPTADSPSYLKAHSGIECAALNGNKNLTSLASLEVFDCPAR
jgi:hypothetical protein